MATATVDENKLAQYERALARAQAEGVAVRGSGPGFYIVGNGTPEHEYIVTRRGNALECGCQAGQHDQYCKHRAAVRYFILHNQAMTQALREGMAWAPVVNSVFTESDRAASDAEQDAWLADMRAWRDGNNDQRAAWLQAHD